MVARPEYCAAVILAGAREVRLNECLGDHRNLRQVMYYADVRYRYYLRAAQNLHPAFGGDHVRFAHLLEAKHFLDFWQANGEDTISALSAVFVEASKTPA